MPEFIKINKNHDFFKDFEIESPVETIEAQSTEIEKLKEQLENPEETIKSLEDLHKQLESEEDKDSKKETKEEKKEEEKEEQEKVETAEPEYSFKPFIEIMSESGVLDLPEGVEIGETAE